MEGDFTVELFDLLVYLIPGAVSLVAAASVMGQRITQLFRNFKTVSSIIGVLVLAFSLGVIAHIVAAGLNGVIIRVSGMSVIGKTIAGFKEFDEVKLRILGHIPVHNPNAGDVYRYAETYVVENGGKQSASFSRLIALSLFCRNSLVPFFIFGIAGFLRGQATKSKLLIGSATLAGGLVLVAGYYIYYQAAVTKVLRTFLVLQAF